MKAYKRSFKKEHDFYILINQEKLPKGIFMGNYNIWDYSIILCKGKQMVLLQ